MSTLVPDIESRTARLYESIHPHNDNSNSIQNYLKTIGRDESYFKDKDILDCGFGGTAWGLELFARAGARSLSGIDLNPRWRERAETRLRSHGIPMDLRTGSVLELPFDADSFDYVHCNGVLHHTPDWQKGIMEIRRVLRPGGVMFLMLYGQFGPVGRVLHGTYRALGKVVPYQWTETFVNKTGLFKDPEVSLLDAMYAPIETHLSERQIWSFLRLREFIKIEFFPSYKWTRQHTTLSHPLLFGRKINHNLWAVKPY